MGEDNQIEYPIASGTPSRRSTGCDRTWTRWRRSTSDGEIVEEFRSRSHPSTRVRSRGSSGRTWPRRLWRRAFCNGPWGWFDDDQAFVRDWGFDLASDRDPVFVWQGRQDLMVPITHGEWLVRTSPVPAHLYDEHGHLSLALGAFGSESSTSSWGRSSGGPSSIEGWEFLQARDPRGSRARRSGSGRSLDASACHCLRISIGIVFVWFGLLKIFDVSPVSELVAKTIYWFDPDVVVPALGVFEVFVGLCLIAGRLMRIALPLLVLQMAGTFLVLVMHPDVAFQGGNPFLLTVEGEFVIKNLVLLSAALVIGSRLAPIGEGLRQRVAPPRASSSAWTPQGPSMSI